MNPLQPTCEFGSDEHRDLLAASLRLILAEFGLRVEVTRDEFVEEFGRVAFEVGKLWKAELAGFGVVQTVAELMAPGALNPDDLADVGRRALALMAEANPTAHGEHAPALTFTAQAFEELLTAVARHGEKLGAGIRLAPPRPQ